MAGKLNKLQNELGEELIRLLKKYDIPGSICGQYSLYNAIGEEFDKMKKACKWWKLD